MMQGDAYAASRNDVAAAKSAATGLVAQLPAGSPYAAAAAPVTGAFKALDAAEAAVTATVSRAFVQWVKANHSKAVVVAAVADAQAKADTYLDQASALAAAARAALHEAVMPARPVPADAAQEGALANLRTDLRMAFDRIGVARLPESMLAELKSRLVTNDSLAVWLLASTDWPALYLKSRGTDPGLFTLRLPQILAQGAPDVGQSVARQLVDTLTSPSGLGGAITSMRWIIRSRLADLADYARWGQLDPAIVNGGEPA